MSHAAELSIVVVASNLLQVTRCLESLAGCAALDQAEVVLVGSLDFSSLQQRFPRQVAVAANPAWSLPKRRAEGMQRASAAHVAVLSEDYRVGDGWAQAVISAREQADVLVGEVTPPQAGWFASACYLWEYLHLAPPAAAGPLSQEQARWAPAGAVVYGKSALDIAAFSAAHSEMEYHQALFDSGKRFYRDARLRVRYEPRVERFVEDRLHRSREWAQSRSASMSLPLRWLIGASRIALPPVLLGRFVLRALARPRYWLGAAAAMPFAAIFACAETLGEVQGYLGRPA